MKTEMTTKIAEMFDIQNGLNSQVCGDDYAEQNIPFYRAAIVESAELFDHRGYKWWKHTDNYDAAAVAQSHLEIVDIWHFLMSHVITKLSLEEAKCAKLETITDYFSNQVQNGAAITKANQLASIDEFIKNMYDINSLLSIKSFAKMMTAFELTFDELYKWYIGKNALNYFRQAHGYKDGTYNKEGWINIHGKTSEDNVVLAEIMDSDVSSFEGVYGALVERYPGINPSYNSTEPGC